MRTLICLLVAAHAIAGEVSLPDTRAELLKSRSNGVQYKLLISTPHDYASSSKRYPVLYLLDADYSFPIARGIVKHLSERERLEPLILVGIAYEDGYEQKQYRLNRTRDYTPWCVPAGGYGPEFQGVSGGAPKFLEFIREQLIPWVDANFRTIPGDRAISGHSYGGLFANWVLLTAPATFTRYIIVSPSLWYNDRLSFRLKEAEPSPARVFLAVGATEGDATRAMVTDLESMAAHLATKKPLAVKHEVFDGENHDSVFPTAVARGIRFVFAGD